MNKYLEPQTSYLPCNIMTDATIRVALRVIAKLQTDLELYKSGLIVFTAWMKKKELKKRKFSYMF